MWVAPGRSPNLSEYVYLEGVAVRRACRWLEAGYSEESILKKREAAVAQGVWRGRAPLGEDAGCSPGTTAPASICASRSALLGLVQRRAWNEQSQRLPCCPSWFSSLFTFLCLQPCCCLTASPQGRSLPSHLSSSSCPFLGALDHPSVTCGAIGELLVLPGLRWGSAFEKGSVVEACAGPGHVRSTVVRGSVRREEKFCME